MEKLDPQLQKTVDQLQTRLDGLKKKISELRKQGRDTLIADLCIVSIPFKIKLYIITIDPKDLNTINTMFMQVEKEIEDALKQPILNEYDAIRKSVVDE